MMYYTDGEGVSSTGRAVTLPNLILHRVEDVAMRFWSRTSDGKSPEDPHYAIEEALQIRFEDVPEAILDALRQVEDPVALKGLRRLAVTVGSLDEFRRKMGSLGS